MSERTVFQAMSQRHVISLGLGATVYEAACVMTRANCCSVLIIDHGSTLLGIVTEHDMMTRVVARAVDPAISAATIVATVIAAIWPVLPRATPATSEPTVRRRRWSSRLGVKVASAVVIVGRA